MWILIMIDQPETRHFPKIHPILPIIEQWRRNEVAIIYPDISSNDVVSTSSEC